MITMFVKIVERDKIQEDTWETETQMRIDYPEFFLGWYWKANSGFEFEDEFRLSRGEL